MLLKVNFPYLSLAIINPIGHMLFLVPGGDSIGIELDYQGVAHTGVI